MLQSHLDFFPLNPLTYFYEYAHGNQGDLKHKIFFESQQQIYNTIIFNGQNLIYHVSF